MAGDRVSGRAARPGIPGDCRNRRRRFERPGFIDATERHLLANVVDDQPKCSFIFPSIVDRSPLVVAISSSGTAPVLARLLREKLESLLPANLGQMAEIAGQWRNKVKARFNMMSDRRRFWEKAFNGLFANQVASGNVEGAKRTLDQ